MPDKKERWQDNVRGKWYVDRSCILCSVCSEAAPKNFKESEEGDHDVVYKQPSSPEEEAQCQDAMDQCPVEAIGKDGDEA